MLQLVIEVQGKDQKPIVEEIWVVRKGKAVRTYGRSEDDLSQRVTLIHDGQAIGVNNGMIFLIALHEKMNRSPYLSARFVSTAQKPKMKKLD